MPGPFLQVRLRLLPTETGGRQRPILSDYRPSWDLGTLWLGQPLLTDGRVFLEDRDELAPGDEGLARIEPLLPERCARPARSARCTTRASADSGGRD